MASDAEFLTGLREQPWISAENYEGSDGSSYVAGTDLAAGIPPSERNVVFAGDVPGGRWALLSIPVPGGYAAAWFVGPVDASPDQMTMSGPVQFVAVGEPMAHVDLSNPERTLVVVAAEGDEILVSPAAELSGTGMWGRTAYLKDAPDGIAVTRLDTDLRFGMAAKVFVNRNDLRVFAGPPTTGAKLPDSSGANGSRWNKDYPALAAILDNASGARYIR